MERSRYITEKTSWDRCCLHFALTYMDGSSGIW